MAIGDLLELTHVQEDDQTKEQIMSKWYYAVVDVFGSASGLFNAWTAEDGMMEAVNVMQVARINNVSVKVVNLFSLTDFYEAAVDREGVYTVGEMLPLFNALNFTLKLDTRGVRPGSKRISGLSEAIQANGIVTDATLITYMNTFAALLDDNVVEAGQGVYDPVVVKRIKYTVGTGDDAHDAYRLPATVEEADYGHVISGLTHTRLSHQVSRGNGR